jgi:heat shock protein HslJ
VRRLTLGVALVVLALFAAACGSEGASELEGTSWDFYGVDTGSGEVPEVAGTNPTIAFDEATVSGSDGCNQFNGPYEISEGNMISIGPLAGTLMACEPDVQAQADAIQAILADAILYEKVDDQLIMRTQDARYIGYDRASGS